jgi:signal transduction histidine kinase
MPSDHQGFLDELYDDRRVERTIQNTMSVVRRYGLAVALACAALILTYVFQRLIQNPVFEFCQAAVVLSAWYGGLGPGITAGIVGALGLDYFFIPPIFELTLSADDFVRLVIFTGVAILTSLLSSKLKKANLKLEEANLEMESRVRQRTDDLSHLNEILKSEVDQRLQAEKTILEISGREQKRLGRDLHDGLCQLIAGTRLVTMEVKKKLESKSVPEATDLATIESNLAEALGQADSISRGLYPVELETNGLMAAFEELSAKMSKIYPVNCQFICWQPVLIPDGTISLHLYRIAQEAVMNAVKGGKAKRVNIRLKRRGEHILLSIADNGIGFQPNPSRHGMGLKIMNYRAKMINASLKFQSHPNHGTVVTCSL